MIGKIKKVTAFVVTTAGLVMAASYLVNAFHALGSSIKKAKRLWKS
jgi:hypothetical protein